MFDEKFQILVSKIFLGVETRPGTQRLTGLNNFVPGLICWEKRNYGNEGQPDGYVFSDGLVR